MPQLFTRLVAATFIVGLAFGLGQANATLRPTLIDLASQPSPVETIGYYRYPCVGSCRYYRYWRPYWYKPHSYRYHYRPYYRHYGYRYRPYPRRRRSGYW